MKYVYGALLLLVGWYGLWNILGLITGNISDWEDFLEDGLFVPTVFLGCVIVLTVLTLIAITGIGLLAGK